MRSHNAKTRYGKPASQKQINQILLSRLSRISQLSRQFTGFKAFGLARRDSRSGLKSLITGTNSTVDLTSARDGRERVR